MANDKTDQEPRDAYTLHARRFRALIATLREVLEALDTAISDDCKADLQEDERTGLDLTRLVEDLHEKRQFLLGQREVAKLLGVSQRTVEKWRLVGGGPPFVALTNRCVRYRREELDAWIQERIHRSTSSYQSGW